MSVSRADAQAGRQYEYELEQEDMQSLLEDEAARAIEEQTLEQIAAMIERCKTCLYADTEGEEPVCLALGITLLHMTADECEDCYELGDTVQSAATDADEGAQIEGADVLEEHG
jgi:hypothetical protein